MKKTLSVSHFILFLFLFTNGFFGFSDSVYAQRISIEGKIISTENIDVDGINIINKSSKSGTISDENGAFKIPVKLNDSLSISAVHIQETLVVVGQEQLDDKKIVVYLTEKRNLLKEVTIRRPLTGYIGTDSNIIPTKEAITATSLGLPNADLPKLSKAESLLYASQSGAFNMLIGAITGETKKLKKRAELEKTVILTEGLLDKFPLTYYVDVLKIDPFKVYSFLFFCEEDPAYKRIVKKSTMEIHEFLTRKSNEFLKRK